MGWLLLDSTALISLNAARSADGRSMLEKLFDKGVRMAAPIAVLRECGLDVWAPCELSSSDVRLIREDDEKLRLHHTITNALERGLFKTEQTLYCCKDPHSRKPHMLPDHAGEYAVQNMGSQMSTRHERFLAVTDDGTGLDAMIGAFQDFAFGSHPPINTPTLAEQLLRLHAITKAEQASIMEMVNDGRRGRQESANGATSRLVRQEYIPARLDRKICEKSIERTVAQLIAA